MNDELRSYESTITFMQKEHERVLHGLHMEIERLQQKCSGNFFRENEINVDFTKFNQNFRENNLLYYRN